MTPVVTSLLNTLSLDLTKKVRVFRLYCCTEHMYKIQTSLQILALSRSQDIWMQSVAACYYREDRVGGKL